MNWIFFAYCLFSLSSSSIVWAEDLDQIKKNGILRVATEGTFRPFSYFEGPTLKGFEVDLAEEIAKRVGVKIHWTTLAFESLLIGLNHNRYDLVIASHMWTPERDQTIDFLLPHYCSGESIVSHEGGPKTVEELRGQIVGAQVGSVNPKLLEKIPGIKKITTYPKDSDGLQSLMAQKIDVLIVEKFIAVDAIKAHPSAHLQIGDFLFRGKNCMAVSKGNKKLRDVVNQILKEIMNDGTYALLSKKYFDEDIRCKQ
jgi:polar amino acid transport system substrate-binding protein